MTQFTDIVTLEDVLIWFASNTLNSACHVFIYLANEEMCKFVTSQEQRALNHFYRIVLGD